jgi:hypothetical protein
MINYSQKDPYIEIKTIEKFNNSMETYGNILVVSAGVN